MNTGLPLSMIQPVSTEASSLGDDHPVAATLGTSTSAVIVNDLFRMLGALASGMPAFSPL